MWLRDLWAVWSCVFTITGNSKLSPRELLLFLHLLQHGARPRTSVWPCHLGNKQTGPDFSNTYGIEGEEGEREREVGERETQRRISYGGCVSAWRETPQFGLATAAPGPAPGHWGTGSGQELAHHQQD